MLRRISEFRAECQRLFHYNPYTGELRNRVRRAQRAKVGELAGTVGTGGYRITAILDKSFTVHRLIFLMMAGYLPEQVDHINGVRDDNRWEFIHDCATGQPEEHKIFCLRGYPVQSWDT